MKIKKGTLFICVAIPLAVGGLSGYISRSGTTIFAMLEKPPLSPPGWLFPIVWTILYILMGIASYLIVTSEADAKAVARAMTVYGAQLTVNFFWSILFFNLSLYLSSLVWLVILWILILITILLFGKISKMAAYLLVPYLVWVTFAGYLNAGVWLLN